MKRNIFLRIGVLMLIAALATSGVFVGSGTYAKYIAGATVDASARVALFQVKVRMASADTAVAEAADGATGWLPWRIFSKSDPTSPLNLTGNKATDTYSWAAADKGLTTLGDALYELSALNGGIPLASTPNVSTTLESTDHVKMTGQTHNGKGEIIAPGTGGKFRLEFKNESEVAVRIWLDSATTSSEITTTDNGTIPANASVGYPSTTPNPKLDTANLKLEYSYDNTNWYNTLAGALTNGGTSTRYIELKPGASTKLGDANSFLYWRWKFTDTTDGTTSTSAAMIAQDKLDTALGVAAAAALAVDSAKVQKLTLKLGFKCEQID